MKIIDLLNKIANGEEVPKKIKYEGDILNYDESIQDYIGVSKTGTDSILNYLFTNYKTNSFINNEVEIIEENKPIEELKLEKQNNKVVLKADIGDYTVRVLDVEMIYKINELVREINELKEN